MGHLNEEITQEWEFWRVVKHNSNFLIFEDHLSFEDLQKLNAVLDMADDYEKVVNQYHEEIQDIKEK